MKTRNLLLIAALGLSALVQQSYAAVLDSLDTAQNFPDQTHGITATANGNGTVTLARTTADQLALIDWLPGGNNLSLATEGQLTITPVSVINNGSWGFSFNFFDGDGNYLGEEIYLDADDNTTPTTQVNVADVLAFAKAQSSTYNDATEYFVRFRIEPWAFTAGSEPGVVFTQIDAVTVPEPTAAVLMLGIVPLLWMSRRQRL